MDVTTQICLGTFIGLIILISYGFYDDYVSAMEYKQYQESEKLREEERIKAEQLKKWESNTESIGIGFGKYIR